MYSFVNDYSEGAHPKVLELLVKYSQEQNKGYGNDVHSETAKRYIKEKLGKDHVDIHFIPGGTQTNLLVISAFLRPHQCVIAADTGHINVHETGAIEATGHKVVTMPAVEGKLTPQAIQAAVDYHGDEHMVRPKMVYISDSTELGTVYTKAELTAIHHKCRENGLLLFLDGARLASALTSKVNDLSLKDIADLTDVFYIGGTKNGALLGEALVICKEELKEDFRYLIKQRGAMMAKGFVMGIQFEALFEENLYFELGEYANRQAEAIAKTLKESGYSFYEAPCSNQLFPILPNTIMNQLSEQFQFLIQARVDESHTAVRFVTSWASSEESVKELVKFFQSNPVNK
ncbi:MAG: ltaE [Herbinix sp.]|jgi:threonine aldolase|nr:ltaE [Herbinix sp.]